MMLYQKDQPRGTLKRLYLDRIVAPDSMVKLQFRALRSLPLLQCEKCKHINGVPYIYPKERRKAYLLEIGSMKKKLSHGTY